MSESIVSERRIRDIEETTRHILAALERIEQKLEEQNIMAALKIKEEIENE